MLKRFSLVYMDGYKFCEFLLMKYKVSSQKCFWSLNRKDKKYAKKTEKSTIILLLNGYLFCIYLSLFLYIHIQYIHLNGGKGNLRCS